VITGSSVGETIPDTSLQAALAWLDSNAVEGGSYTITLQNDETIAPKTLFYSGKTVGIILTGGTSERTVNLSTTGSLFSVESGVTLTLDNNITLQGRSDNTVSLVQVNSGGALVMNTGSKVSGNTNTPSYGDSPRGGGIYNTGNFTMNGGEISGNTAQYVTYGADGGGIYNTGNFTMNDGKISNNTAVYGGGVYIGGTFTMNGGEISGNNAVASSHGGYPGIGGGIYAIYTTVTMTNGNICDNTAGAYGGGIYTFGTDSSSASFTMNGGTISGNTAPRGGGVYVSGNSTLTKQSGGTIYGSNASDTLKNTATYGDSYGHAVYVYADSGSKLRNTTADSGITLDSTVSGAIGGWEFPAHSVQISLQPVSDGPQLENISLFANESAQFFAGSGYTSWTWYWNGDPISGMASSTYTLAAYSKTPGIYELSVVVTTSAGHKLSARCRVVVKAN
jgi:hypothetical protein